MPSLDTARPQLGLSPLVTNPSCSASSSYLSCSFLGSSLAWVILLLVAPPLLSFSCVLPALGTSVLQLVVYPSPLSVFPSCSCLDFSSRVYSCWVIPSRCTPSRATSSLALPSLTATGPKLGLSPLSNHPLSVHTLSVYLPLLQPLLLLLSLPRSTFLVHWRRTQPSITVNQADVNWQGDKAGTHPHTPFPPPSPPHPHRETARQARDTNEIQAN